MTIQEIKLTGEPILILQFTPPSDPFEMKQMEHCIVQAPLRVGDRLYVIVDCSYIDVSFSDVVAYMAKFRNYPLSCILVLVGSQAIINLEEDSRDLPLFATLAEALAYIRFLIGIPHYVRS